MSRSGYTDDVDGWALIRWRGAVKSAIRGKRGREFLRKLIAALDALPEKRLIAGELEMDGEVCAMGSVGKMQGIDMSNIDPTEPEEVAAAFNISPALAQEIAYVNDEWLSNRATDEERYSIVRKWAEKQLLSGVREEEAN